MIDSEYSQEELQSQKYISPDINTRILLVDDDIIMLKYLRAILSTYWMVESAADGLEALNIIRNSPPDLIVSDVMMPNMDGFELLAEIRKENSIRHIPFILLSAKPEEEVSDRGLEKGANDYLLKPIAPLELLARIRTQLEIRETKKDIHKLKEAEEELKKFKIISDYAFDAFILMREDGTFAYLNDQAINRWGYTRDEIKSLKVPDVDPIYQESKFKELFAQLQKKGSIPPFETIHKKKDGTTFPVEVSLGGIILSGEPHMFAVARDITERKQSEEALKIKNEQLQKSNNELDNFIYTASHDLKAPITNIEGLMGVLIDNLNEGALQDPIVKKVVTMIEKSIDRFKNTINELSEMSKLQKSLEDDVTEISFPEVLDEVKLDLEILIQNSGTTFIVDFNQCTSIKYSKKNLRSILYNLVSNSIKYSSPERQPVINISTTKENEYCVLTIEDNGLGMDLSKERKIFSMFKRLHDHVEGTGVGLYIVKKIVENNGGQISVESKVGIGSKFKVRFLNNMPL